jgi:hypothetical protein
VARHAAEWLTLNKKSDFAATAAASSHEHLRAQNFLIFARKDFGWTQSCLVADGHFAADQTCKTVHYSELPSKSRHSPNHPVAAISGAGARSRKRHVGFPRLLKNSCHSGSDPETAIDDRNFVI